MKTLDFSRIISAQEKARQQEAESVKLFEARIQNHIDFVARQRKYRDGFALAGYASSSVPEWSSEAEIFIAWRDHVWTEAFKAMKNAALLIAPDAFIAILPQPQWAD